MQKVNNHTKTHRLSQSGGNHSRERHSRERHSREVIRASITVTLAVSFFIASNIKCANSTIRSLDESVICDSNWFSKFVTWFMKPKYFTLMLLFILHWKKTPLYFGFIFTKRALFCVFGTYCYLKIIQIWRRMIQRNIFDKQTSQ